MMAKRKDPPRIPGDDEESMIPEVPDGATPECPHATTMTVTLKVSGRVIKSEICAHCHTKLVERVERDD